MVVQLAPSVLTRTYARSAAGASTPSQRQNDKRVCRQPVRSSGVSDVFAVAAIKAAKRLGISIPKDLGVIGFDNTNISIMSEPALTTVKQPQYQLGFLACEMLIEQMHSESFAPRQIMLDAEIIIRESL